MYAVINNYSNEVYATYDTYYDAKNVAWELNNDYIYAVHSYLNAWKVVYRLV